MRYYKQRFGAERAVVLSHNKNAVGRVLRQYRALGWGGEGEGRFSMVLTPGFDDTGPVWEVIAKVRFLHA